MKKYNLSVGLISKDTAKKLSPKFFSRMEEHGYNIINFDDVKTWKRGTMLILREPEYSKRNPKEYRVVKITSVTYPGSDYEVIRVGDGQYTWRISSSEAAKIQ